MALKTILNVTPTRATFSVTGTFSFDSIDFDMDVDTLGRDETVTTPNCVILQIDYDIKVGNCEIYRVTDPNLTPILTLSPGVGTIVNTGQQNLSTESDKDLRVFIEDGTVTITLKKESGFTTV
jgi:hypothetical protein